MPLLARQSHHDGPGAIPSAADPSNSRMSVFTDSAPSASGTASSAVGRTFASQMAFMFSRPIRLFRPVKVSSLTALQALAQQRGQDLSPQFARTLAREEGFKVIPRHILPPLVINSVLGFFLFASFSTTQSVLEYTRVVSSGWIPAISGGVAGFVQSIVSSPLDNIRLVLQNRAEQAWPGWAGVFREAIFPTFIHPFHLAQGTRSPTSPSAATNVRRRWKSLRRWAARGWSNIVLSSTRDVLGFALFFTVFERGRDVALKVRTAVDKRWSPPQSVSRAIQALCIIFGGTLAGVSFGLVSRPFDISRGFIWETRMEWAKQWQDYNAEHASPNRSSSSPRSSSPPAPPTRLPGAWKILRRFVREEGVTTLVGFPKRPPVVPHAAQFKITNHPALGGQVTGDQGGNEFLRNTRRNPQMKTLARRVLTFVPPYTLGFLAWAIMSGDLK